MLGGKLSRRHAVKHRSVRRGGFVSLPLLSASSSSPAAGPGAHPFLWRISLFLFFARLLSFPPCRLSFLSKPTANLLSHRDREFYTTLSRRRRTRRVAATGDWCARPFFLTLRIAPLPCLYGSRTCMSRPTGCTHAHNYEGSLYVACVGGYSV